MNETFEASNGVTVMRNPDDWPDIDYQSWSIGNAREVLLAPHEIDALREFFQHERDQELGRWRWPGDQKWVVYKSFSYLVINEERGTATYLPLAGWSDAGTDPAHRAVLAAYEAAHPKPKPWHDAEPGEVWVVRVENGTVSEEMALTCVEDSGELWLEDPVDETRILVTGSIVAGRRIWPEVSDA